MKKNFFRAFLVLMVTPSFALDYKIGLEARGDLVNASKKTVPQTGVDRKTSYNNFSNGDVKINFQGNVNEKLDLRVRVRLLSGIDPVTSRENSGQTLEFAYVDHKNQYFTTRIGKQIWDAHGTESFGKPDFIASVASDNYYFAYGDVYRFGVSTIFNFMETNSLTFALSNPNNTFTDSSGVETKNNSLAMGVYYSGSFFDKLFQPTFGYTTAKQDADSDATLDSSKTKSGNNTLIGVGVRSEKNGIRFDLDYKVFNKENRNAGTNTSQVKENTKAIYANLGYKIGDFNPIFTFITDKFKKENNPDSDFKKNQFAVGTYWQPFKDIDFRYHLMYTSQVTKYDSTLATNKKLTDNRFWLGFKANI